MNIANQPFKFIENIHQRSSVNICQNSSPGMRHPDPERVARKASHRINAKPLDIFRKTKKVQLPTLILNGYEGFTLSVKNPKNDGYAKLSHNSLVVFL